MAESSARMQVAEARHGSLAGDLWGGGAAMLVAFPSAIAFGMVVFGAAGVGQAARGATFGVLGALALGIIAPIFGGRPGIVSAPCAPSAAVLAALVAACSPGLTVDRIVVLVTIATVAAGLLQIAIGMLGGGKLIRFIPYPVVAGYLTAVGLLIAWKQLPRLFGIEHFAGWNAALNGVRWEAAAVGLVTIAVAVFGAKLTDRVPASILALGFGIATYAALSAAHPELRNVDGNRLVVGHLQAADGFDPAQLGQRLKTLLLLQRDELQTALATALTLAVLLSIDTLKTALVVDAMTHSRHDPDKELRAQGLGNLAAALVGGMPGAGTAGPTVVNIGSGGRSRRSGLFAGLAALLVFVGLGGLVARVPVAALAGVLFVVGMRMIDLSMLDLVQRADTRLDFAVVAGVVITGLAFDLITASGVGVGLSILLFVRDQSRTSIVRRRATGDVYHSKRRRSAAERECLENSKDAIVLMELQGGLFFGTADHLFGEIEPSLATTNTLILDLRAVRSCDLTAARVLRRVATELAQHDHRLVFSGIGRAPGSREIERYLQLFHLLQGPDACLTFDDLHDAVSWAEDRYLEQRGRKRPVDEALLSLGDFDVFADLSPDVLTALEGCTSVTRLNAGDCLFRRGMDGDTLFLIRRGVIRIVLAVGGGSMHLATLEPGSTFGEVAFLDPGPRSADAVAETTVELFVLSRSAFDRVTEQRPEVAARVFERLAIAEAHRLRSADRALKHLEQA